MLTTAKTSRGEEGEKGEELVFMSPPENLWAGPGCGVSRGDLHTRNLTPLWINKHLHPGSCPLPHKDAARWNRDLLERNPEAVKGNC